MSKPASMALSRAIWLRSIVELPRVLGADVPVQIHFWPCSERHVAENTSCCVHMQRIEEIYRELEPRGGIHPKGSLQKKPWGFREFTVLDEDRYTFVERPPNA